MHLWGWYSSWSLEAYTPKKLFYVAWPIFVAFSTALCLHRYAQDMITIKGIAVTLLWFLSIRDLVTGDVQSLPAPGGVREDRCPSCALEANQSRNLTRNEISLMVSRLSKWETYVLAICFYDRFLTILVHFFPFFQCRDVSRHTRIYIYICLSKYRCIFIENLQKTWMYCFFRMDVTVMVTNLCWQIWYTRLHGLYK